MNPALMDALRDGVIFYIILALSVALHEFGHAKAADLLGDPLPRFQGRVTLNPLAHLDPIGTGLIPLCMIFLPILFGSSIPFALVGWGKPVQIALNNPRTRKRDEILITLAGPAMNVLIALLAAIGAGLTQRFSHNTASADLWVDIISLNCALIAFNLIPLPPLDGSRILRHIAGISEETFYNLAVNSWWILLILINLRPFQVLLSIVINWISVFFFQIADTIGG